MNLPRTDVTKPPASRRRWSSTCPNAPIRPSGPRSPALACNAGSTMMDVPLPQLAEREIRLVATSRRAAGPDTPAQPVDALEGRVKLGGPFAVPVTPGYLADSADLRTFVEQEAARYRYYLVHISVTFE